MITYPLYFYGSNDTPVSLKIAINCGKAERRKANLKFHFDNIFREFPDGLFTIAEWSESFQCYLPTPNANAKEIAFLLCEGSRRNMG